MGPWLGSLTIPLAKGIARNVQAKSQNRRVHAYDRFIWDELMEDWVAGSEYAGRVDPGGDFKFLYEEITREFEHHLVVNKSDLSIQEWDGKPIEFLLNDATKTLEIVANVLRQFFGALIPQSSHVAHQDYLWFTEAYIPICMHRLKDYFAHVYTVPDTCMVLFRTLDSIPRRALDFQLDYQRLDPREITDACEWNLSILEESAHVLIRAGSAWMLYMRGKLAEARAIFEEIERDPLSISMRYQFQRSVLETFGMNELLDLTSVPWFFADKENLAATFPASDQSRPYWDSKLGWLWTSVDSYPVFYSDKLTANLEYQLSSIQPRLFKNLNDGSTIRA